MNSFELFNLMWNNILLHEGYNSKEHGANSVVHGLKNVNFPESLSKFSMHCKLKVIAPS